MLKEGITVQKATLKTLILNLLQGERFDKTTTSLLSGQFAGGICFKKQANLAITKGFEQTKG